MSTYSALYPRGALDIHVSSADAQSGTKTGLLLSKEKGLSKCFLELLGLIEMMIYFSLEVYVGHTEIFI